MSESEREAAGATRSDLRLVPAALAGWLAAALLVSRRPVEAALLAGAAVLLGGVVLAGSHRWRARVALLLLAVAAVAGSTAGQLALRESGPLTELADHEAVVSLEGLVRSEPRPLAGREGLRLELSARAVSGRGREAGAAARVLVLAGAEWAGVDFGERVRLEARLSRAEPGEDVLVLARALGPPEVLARAGPVDRAVTRLRTGLLEVSADLAPDAAALVPGLALGDTSRIDPALDQAMKDVSLTHVTAVSGAHFAIVGAAVLGLVTLLGAPRAWRALAVVLVTFGFVLLVHPEPSVMRAAVMGTIGALALLLGRPSAALPALAAATLGLVVVDPWLARSFGFVLSVLATAGLVLLARPLASRLEPWMPGWLAHALAVPAAAQLACAPVLVLLAPSLSLFAVPANLLAAPALVPGTVLGVLATLLAPAWPGGAHALAVGAGWACSWIAAVARGTASLPGAVLPWPEGPAGAVLLAVLLLGAGLALSAARRSRAARLVLLALLAIALAVSPPGRRLALELWPEGWPPPGWQVVLCDVGQGTALVVRSGEASAVVVDVGPADGGAGECLDRLGVRRVELLVLSHFHADHVEGLAGVLAGRTVEAALVSPLHEPAPQAAAALAALEGRGVPVRAGSAGLAGSSGEVSWRVLWPEGERPPPEPNDASLVLWLSTPSLSVLALGDLETEAQDSLARELAALGVRRPARVVVMAHHGSARQSPALARILDPEVLLVGVGKDNGYGHPAPAALELYRGALVLRSDTCGDLAVTASHRSPCSSGEAQP